MGDDVAIDIFPAQEGTSFYATLTDPTAAGGSGLNLGWVQPDLEEQAFFDLENPVGAGADGDPTQVVHYASLVANGWGAIPQMNYQPGYETYDQQLSDGSVFVRFGDPASLNALKTGLTVDLPVDLGVVAASRAEVKTTKIAVGLEGAEANAPTVECLLTHGGTMVNRKADKSLVDLRAPRTDPTILNARTSDLTQTDASVDVRQQFWGRSPFTTWTLEIESGVAQQTALDMSNLKQIVIRIDYSALVIN